MTTRVDTAVLRQLIQDTPNKLDDWIGSLAYEIHGEIVQELTETSPGAPYIRYQPRRSGIASRVGDAPNVDIGTLRASMEVIRASQHHWLIQDGVEYGIYLEDGTETMGHRPFVAPVFAQWSEARIADSAVSFGLLEP